MINGERGTRGGSSRTRKIYYCHQIVACSSLQMGLAKKARQEQGGVWKVERGLMAALSEF
jgi:hypothetical protein